MHDRIKFVRTSNGLSMREFALRIGISHGAISLIESNKRNISQQTVKSICREFNVNEDWLLTGNGEPFNQLEEDAELAEWIGRVMHDDSMAAQKRALQIFKNIKNSDLETIEKLIEIAYDIIKTHRGEE